MKYIIKHINNYLVDDLYKFYDTHKSLLPNLTKLKKEEDKLSSILGRLLLLKLLEDKNISIIYNKNGKPYIKNNPIYFNISHKDGYVAVVVSNKKCGIDIETYHKINLSSLKIFATKEEQNYILDNIENNFYEIYTLKEATLKMYGKKLSDIKNINTQNKKRTIIKNDNYFVTIIESED